MQPGLWDRFQARTDLALEERERFPGDGGEVTGVVLKEKERSGGFRLTEVTILDEEGARQMGKPAGVYLTLEAPLFFGREEKQLKAAAGETAALLGRLFSRHGIGKTKAPGFSWSDLGIRRRRRTLWTDGAGAADDDPTSFLPWKRRERGRTAGSYAQRDRSRGHGQDRHGDG